MITNERQYRITKSDAERFEKALESVLRHPDLAVDPTIRQAEVESLRSQLADLRAQIAEYESLRAGEPSIIEIDSLAELPTALIKARISSGMSQKDLAARLSIKEQQVQRYEASGYMQASLSRLLEVATALQIRLRNEVFLPSSQQQSEAMFKRFHEVGLDKKFLLKRFVPDSTGQEPPHSGDQERGLVFSVLTAVSHVFGWKPSAVMGAESLWLEGAALSGARFKKRESADETKLAAYSIYAHFLALQLLRATCDLTPKPIPRDAAIARAEILKYGDVVTFESALRYVWDLGIPVLPLSDPGAFSGACWRVTGRNVIVLKQRTKAMARWLDDLLHELWHAGSEPKRPSRDVVEPLSYPSEGAEADEESDARCFAADVVLGGRSEELVEVCVREANGLIPRLKRVVPQVAEREGVSRDGLANYMAYRLSLQGENWWGAATNLQEKGNPWLLARDILLERADLSQCTGIEAELLTQALVEEERASG